MIICIKGAGLMWQNHDGEVVEIEELLEQCPEGTRLMITGSQLDEALFDDDENEEEEDRNETVDASNDPE